MMPRIKTVHGIENRKVGSQKRGSKGLFMRPDLDAGHVRLTLLHGTEEELLQQVLHRLLMGDIQQQMHGEIRIEPIITIRFHDVRYLSEAGRFLNSIRTIIRTFKFSSLPIVTSESHTSLVMSKLRNSRIPGTR